MRTDAGRPEERVNISRPTAETAKTAEKRLSILGDLRVLRGKTACVT